MSKLRESITEVFNGHMVDDIIEDSKGLYTYKVTDDPRDGSLWMQVKSNYDLTDYCYAHAVSISKEDPDDIVWKIISPDGKKVLSKLKYVSWIRVADELSAFNERYGLTPHIDKT